MIKKPEDYLKPDEPEDYQPDLPPKDGEFELSVDIENNEQAAIITFTKPL